MVDDELCCPTCSWEYHSTTLSITPEKHLFNKWEVFDNLTGEKLAQLDGTNVTFIYAWPYKTEYRVRLTVTEKDGDMCYTEKVYFDEACFAPCPPVGGGGGGAPPYQQNAYEEEDKCEIIIKKVYLSDLDEFKEPIQVITIKEVKFE